MTNFPGGLDNFTNPTSLDNFGTVGVKHSEQHTNLADAVEAVQAKVGMDGSGVTGSLDYKIRAVVPVGAVLPWLKSLTGVPALPANFVECNGQTLSDSDSPLNEQVIPDLNGGNRFLRGNATSGGTGGGATHTHDYSGTVDQSENTESVENNTPTVSVANSSHLHNYSGTTEAGSSLPPYFDVVWIIRIK